MYTLEGGGREYISLISTMYTSATYNTLSYTHISSYMVWRNMDIWKCIDIYAHEMEVN